MQAHICKFILTWFDLLGPRGDLSSLTVRGVSHTTETAYITEEKQWRFHDSAIVGFGGHASEACCSGRLWEQAFPQPSPPQIDGSVPAA